MRGGSAIVVCVGFVLACSDQEAGSGGAGSGGAAPAGGGTASGASATAGANAIAGGGASGGTPTPPSNGGGSDSSGGDLHAPTAGRVGLTPQPCSLTAPTECPGPELRYATVEPIFRERCVVCHAGTPGGPWPLNSYGHVASWRDTIRAALLGCAMPPADSGMTIPPADSQLILEWIRCGMPP